MTAIRATFYDGKSSDTHDVVLDLDPRRGLCVRGEGVDLAWPLSEVRASERIGSSRRRLYFPDGSQCETADNDAVDALFEGQGQGLAPAAGRLLHRWESGLGYALGALVLTAAAAWAFIAWGIPAIAKQVAFALPPATEKVIGRDALAALDRFALAPSTLGEERQAALRKIHAGMASSGDRLEFRKGGRIGPNALALPAGIIVVTDELVALSKDDREIEAVLAHETGHLRQRHVLRHVLQDSATALLVAFTIGDVASLGSIAAAAGPTMLLQAKFSRDFEREADDYALEYLARRGIPAEMFGAILQRMEEKRGGAKSDSDYLSTHPATRERIERASRKR